MVRNRFTRFTFTVSKMSKGLNLKDQIVKLFITLETLQKFSLEHKIYKLLECPENKLHTDICLFA